MKFFVCQHVSIWGFQNRVRLSVHLSAPREKKSPWLRQYQSYISNWYINGKVFTSTTPWKPKNWIFFQKKVWNSNFDLFQRAEIIQVGLNMHLYDGIGDASSSLWGSTSSYRIDEHFSFREVNCVLKNVNYVSLVLCSYFYTIAWKILFAIFLVVLLKIVGNPQFN